MEGKTIKKVEVLKKTTVVARNFPTEVKPYAIRLHFTDGTSTDIGIDARGYYGDFTHFLKISE